jgi:hypothetical protein
MAQQTINPKEIALILLFGAIGGGLSLVYAATVGQPIQGSLWVAVPGSVVLGTFAAFIGVYVIANTDTSDFLRCLGFSLLCGFAWKPVYDAGSALVTQQTRANQIAKVQQLNETVGEAVSEVASKTTKPTADDIAKAASAAFSAIDEAHKTGEVEVKIGALKQASALNDALKTLKSEGRLPTESEGQLQKLDQVVDLHRNTIDASLRALSDSTQDAL